jgi:PncC family amidohydrolase
VTSGASAGADAYELAGQILARLAAGGRTVAVAESLTGGLVAAALTDVPGASASFRGGVVTYATELKAALLGVDRGMLARHGAVYAPVAAALTDIPGASASFRGGVVTYATELKAALLGVDRGMLARHGAVYAPVAAAMAAGVRTRLGATYGVATTGVAGPEPADGQPVGTAHIAVSAADDTVVRTIVLSGDRHVIRRLTVEHALGLLLGRLREDAD